MAKQEPWTSRNGSALIDAEEDEAAYLRPAAASRRRPRKAARPAEDDLSDEVEAYLRARRRVSPRKGSLVRRMLGNRFGRLVLLTVAAVVLASAGMAAWAVRSFFLTDPHFRIDSSAQVQSSGNAEFTRKQLMDVFGSDLGRNIFRVPLAKREAQLEAQPWIASATVMRLMPAILRVRLVERVPVAFARVGHEVELVDADGVLLSMAPATMAARHYSFPVVTGLDPNGPPSARADRMHLYARFIAALNSDGQRLSGGLSEVDLSDVDDVRAIVPAQGSDILLHFGDSDFLERYRSFQQHVGEWRSQYPNLSAVDLRYDRQVVLKMADAAQADEAAETRPMQDPGSATFTPQQAKPAAVPAHTAAPRAHAAPAHHKASAKAAPAHTGRHAQKKPQKKWAPHYIPHAGRGM